MKLDNIDLHILQMLEEDGRITNKDMAERLDVSIGTVRNRINRLTEDNLLQIKGLCNPNKFEDKQYVFLIIQLKGNSNSIEMAEKIAEIPEIRSVSIITGRYDIVAEIFIEPSNLIEFLNSKLTQKVPIHSVESWISLRSFNKWI